MEQWECTRPRFLAGQLLRFTWMRTNLDGREIATTLSKRLFRKEMRAIQRLCGGTCRRISQQPLAGTFAAVPVAMVLSMLPFWHRPGEKCGDSRLVAAGDEGRSNIFDLAAKEGAGVVIAMLVLDAFEESADLPAKAGFGWWRPSTRRTC